MTAAEVRERFPKPVYPQYGLPESGIYCVGGAACEFATGTPHRFPHYTAIARILRITVEQAGDIVRANDRGDFERAWQLLDEALPKT